MSSFNQSILMGNLAQDPTVTKVSDNSSVTRFTIAANRVYKNKDGESINETDFIDCEAWSKVGEFINKYFSKGKPILVSGRIKQDKWKTEDGENRTKYVIVVDTAKFVGLKSDSNNGNSSREAVGSSVGDSSLNQDDLTF